MMLHDGWTLFTVVIDLVNIWHVQLVLQNEMRIQLIQFNQRKIGIIHVLRGRVSYETANQKHNCALENSSVYSWYMFFTWNCYARNNTIKVTSIINDDDIVFHSWIDNGEFKSNDIITSNFHLNANRVVTYPI